MQEEDTVENMSSKRCTVCSHYTDHDARYFGKVYEEAGIKFLRLADDTASHCGPSTTQNIVSFATLKLE